MSTIIQDSAPHHINPSDEDEIDHSDYTGYITRTFLQLDGPGQTALSSYAAALLKEQRDDERVMEHGALTMAEIERMTLGDLQRLAQQIGVSSAAILRVAEKASA